MSPGFGRCLRDPNADQSALQTSSLEGYGAPIIDLAHLIITRWIVGQNAPFEVWGPAGTARQMDKLLDYMHWDIEVRREHMHHREPPVVKVTEVEVRQMPEW